MVRRQIEMVDLVSQMVAERKILARGLTDKRNVKQRWLFSLRGCIRTSSMLCQIGRVYR